MFYLPKIINKNKNITNKARIDIIIMGTSAINTQTITNTNTTINIINVKYPNALIKSNIFLMS